MFTESPSKKKHLLNVVLREFKYRHTAVSVDPVECAADDIIFRNASPASRCPLHRFKDSL